MSSEEAAACDWLAEHTVCTDTVLAPVDSAQFIPAWAGNRTVYGHPFETIDAENKKAEVERFFGHDSSDVDRRGLLDRYGVRYVLFTEPESLQDAEALGLILIWSSNETTIYQVIGEP